MNLADAKAFMTAHHVDRVARDIVAAPDDDDAQVHAEHARRALRGALVGGSLARLMPAIERLAISGGGTADGLVRTTDDGTTIAAEFLTADGVPAFRARIKRTSPREGRSKHDFSLTRLPPDGYGNEERIVSGGMIWREPRPGREVPEVVVFANADRSARLPDWFAFAQTAMASLPLAGEAEAATIMDCWEPEAPMALIAADGGLTGRHCRQMIEAQEAAIMRAQLPRIASLVREASVKLRDNGFVWNRSFMAYNDADIRSCAVPLPDGLAIFHENVDLIADHAQFVAIAKPGGDAEPRVVCFHALDRRSDSPAALIAALASGDAPPPQASLDLVSGTLLTRTAIDVTQIGEYLQCAITGDIEAVDRWASGDRKWIGSREGFEDFEPFKEDGDLDGEDVGGEPPPAP